jgi:hypothetical protein
MHKHLPPPRHFHASSTLTQRNSVRHICAVVHSIPKLRRLLNVGHAKISRCILTKSSDRRDCTFRSHAVIDFLERDRHWGPNIHSFYSSIILASFHNRLFSWITHSRGTWTTTSSKRHMVCRTTRIPRSGVSVAQLEPISAKRTTSMATQAGEPRK